MSHAISPDGAARELQRIQRWMQAVIAHPDGIAAGVESDEARREIDIALERIDEVVSPSRNLPSEERLAIYGRAYYSRLLECLRSVYPIVAQTVGEEAFDALAFGYLRDYPSRSYTLDHLGASFAQFLDETRPDRDATGAPKETWPDFLIDLARLEWAIGEVFDGPGIEGRPPLAAEDLLAIGPQRWPEARLVPAPCLRLLRFGFPVNDHFTELRRETGLREEPGQERSDEPPLPDPAATYLALTRRDFVVRRHALNEAQFELLHAIMADETVGQAITHAAEAVPDLESLAADLRSWFHEWATAGFFSGILHGTK